MVLRIGSLIDLWDRLRTSYWFVPAVMFVLAALIAAGMLTLDYALAGSPEKFHPWFPRFGSEAARSILSTIASGLLTVTGVVFSLTIVTLQLASSQFGPRLLRSFMTKLGTQIVLGTFTASFIYCIIIIGSIRGDGGFVPQLSTAGGILLGVIDIAVLIYFIHHVATSIRIETVMETLVDDLREVIDGLFPEALGASPPDESDVARQLAALPEDARPVPAQEAGYIRHIDRRILMNTAVQHDLILRIDRRPGDFVVQGVALLHVLGPEPLAEEVAERLRRSVIVGPDRTPREDVSFAIRQLVEVAVRALSPGVNDPYTAIECTNRLGQALCRVVRRQPPSACRVDDDGRLRVIAPPLDLPVLLRAAFDPVARAGGSNGEVALVLLHTLSMIASCAMRPDDRRAVIDLAQDLARQFDAQLPLERDRRVIAQRFSAALYELARAEEEEPSRARKADADATTGEGAAVPLRQPLRFETEEV